LLGIVTLEILGLVLNPFKRTLQPMRMFLIWGAMKFDVVQQGELRFVQANRQL